MLHNYWKCVANNMISSMDRKFKVIIIYLFYFSEYSFTSKEINLL